MVIAEKKADHKKYEKRVWLMTLTKYTIIILKSVNPVTFLQWKSTTLLLQSLVHIKRRPTRPWPSALSHDNRLRRCIFHFPSSVLWFLSARLTPIGHYSFYFKRRIKAMCYKCQMWLSQLSSSDIMWLHKPPTVSLLPLNVKHSWSMMINKQNYCWKKRSNSSKTGEIIKWSFSFTLDLCVKYDLVNTSQRSWKHCERLTSLLITEQAIILGFGSSAAPLRIWSDHGN